MIGSRLKIDYDNLEKWKFPGSLLLFVLQTDGKTQAQFAKEIGWTRSKVNQIIKGKRAITANSALKLLEHTGIPPFVWMEIQSKYEVEKEKRLLGIVRQVTRGVA